MTRQLGVGWTKRMLADRFVLGSRQPPIVGSAAMVADALQACGGLGEADVDGFNLSPHGGARVLGGGGGPAGAVSELQCRGVYKQAYAPGTYREKLFGAGPRLAAPHPAAAARHH